MASLVGQTVGRYKVLAELGRGGMGVVYRALDTTLNREVALKVLPPEVTSDPDRRRRFLREAQTASQLEHAHIGVIHEVADADGVSFIAMELVRGESLAALITRGGLTTPRALELAAEIAEGLARAHEQGVIHRDLKPANVMVTDDGHAKIIDFGLAKAIASETTPDAATVAASTDFGSIKGTAAYMSPEQTRGDKLDARSDVFSFGIVLYQMLTGRLPFQAPSYVDTLHAIVHDPVPPLSLPISAVGPDAQQDLQRLIDKCLAKDASARYQTARDLVVDLRSVRRRLDSTGVSTVASGSTMAPAVARSSPAARRLAVWAVSLALVAAAGAYWWTHRAPPPPPPMSTSGRPSVAVLYFQNNTGNSQLDWLRTGLTDMVVTDLSQSADMNVLSTDRLYQILASLKRQNDPVITFDTVKEVARLAGVQHVLTGNYIKAGETIRINVTLQDVASGRIITAEHLEAAGEGQLFPTVDSLTRRVQTQLASVVTRPTPVITAPGAAGAPAGSGLYRDLQDVTTASIDAYREYAQGVAFLERGRPTDAEPRLLEALRIDPEFALAMARLAAVENNLRRPDKRAEYAKAALERAERLPAKDRYYLEGFFYAGDESTVERGVEAYRKLLGLYPDHYSAKHNLANTLTSLEQFAESARLSEELRAKPFVLPITLSNLALTYSFIDQYDQAMAVVAESERRFPDAALTARQRGDVNSIFGRFDEAAAAYARAASINPEDPTHDTDQLSMAVLQGRWSDADGFIRKLSASTDPFVRFATTQSRALLALYHGRSEEGMRLLDAATKAPGPWGPTFDSELNLEAARCYLLLGEPARALPHADAARQHSGDTLLTPMTVGQIRAATALNRLGRKAESAALVDRLTTRAGAVDGPRFKGLANLARGTVMLDNHDVAGATAVLVESERALPARQNFGPPPVLPELWYVLGSAYLSAGNDAEAEKRFTLLATRGEHFLFPIEHVRSLYWLGQISERRGDQAKAREYYQRFLSYWGDGDIDREHVADAKKKIK